MPQGSEPQLLVPFCRLTYTVEPAWPALPARCPARVRLFRVLLGQRPSLRGFLQPSLAFVRPLHRYYAAVRLPAALRVGLMAHGFLPPFHFLSVADDCRVSRFSCVKFPCMPGVCDSAGPKTRSRCRAPPRCLPVNLTPSAPMVLIFSDLINFRHTQPTSAPSQRFKCGLCVAPPSHGSGPGWFRYSFPVCLFHS